VRSLAWRTQDRFESVDAFLSALRDENQVVQRYSDTEVEAIVKRAADDQVANPTDAGMSLKTVQQIANDVGISPDRVERAARDIESRTPNQPSAESGPGAFWLGSPTLVGWERVVEGEASDSTYDELIDEIQAAFSTEGQVDRRGRSITWRTVNPVLGKTRALQVRVTARGGKTRFQLQERLGEMATAIHGGIMGGGGAGGVAVILGVGLGVPLGPPEVVGLLALGWAGGLWALTRSIFRAVARKKRTDLEQLGERLMDIVAEPTQDTPNDNQQSRQLGR
jgi:hypothetical protein